MKDIYNLNETPEKSDHKQSVFSVFTMITLFILGNFIVGLLLFFIYLVL